jgi:hypothetical protein
VDHGELGQRIAAATEPLELRNAAQQSPVTTGPSFGGGDISGSGGGDGVRACRVLRSSGTP